MFFANLWQSPHFLSPRHQATPRRRGRRRNGPAAPGPRRVRRLRLESLESRQLLTAAVADVGLVADTGASARDLITRDARLTGAVSWTGTPSMVWVEFDHNGDGVPEGNASVGQSGDSFQYDPVSHDSVLAGWDGPLEIRYRPVAYESGATVAGAWSAFTFTLDRMAPMAVSFAPSEQETVFAPPSEVRITFNEPLDPSSVTSASVRVVADAAGPLQPTGTTLAGDRELVAQLDAAAVAPDRYTMHASQVTDLAGNTNLLQFPARWQYLSPPQTSGFGPVEVQEDSEPTEILLWDVFDDAETPDNELLYGATYDTASPLLSGVEIDPATGILTVSYAANAHGTAEITVQATDSDGLTIAAILPITVHAVNDPPQIVDFVGIEGPTVWSFEGTVVDDDLTNAVVLFGGILDGETAPVQPDGKFFLTTTLAQDGLVSAIAQDSMGLTSATKYYLVHTT